MPLWFGAGLVAIIAVAAYITFWRHAGAAGAYFGIDLTAYTSAADRLVATGSPYSAQVMQGPVDNTPENVPIGYFYPPVLAQMFVPLRAIPIPVLATIWAVVQGVILIALLPALAPRSMSRPWRFMVAVGVGLIFFPMQWALYIGNLSGWLAIAVAVCLLASKPVGGCVSALAVVLKLTPGPLLAAAVADRRMRRSALISAFGIIAVSFAVSPGAWIDWITILPNVLRNGMSMEAVNLSPAKAFAAVGLPLVGSTIGWILTIGFGVGAVIVSSREGLSMRVVAMAVFATTFAGH